MVLGAILSPADVPPPFPDDFVRQQIEAEWRKKVMQDLEYVKGLTVKAEPHHRSKTMLEVLPAVISGLTVIASVIGMLWSFMLNQTTYQAMNSQKLDQFGSTLADIRKNSDQVPLIGIQLQNMEFRQKTTEEQGKSNEKKLIEMAETLARMGVRTSK